ncbi:YueI family protein [Streptococcus moroccensis]|uniref:Uncharacterized protein YueI n=1 Tax=Streptococcus moroccensis TaxID=1451356 RepID=A0ABT9YR96_9STRE|nr:YueI family protein [Streptococcus moroccensis]MDQ0222521.1 uncharacterized protein YueI [Streptococcus moroccensis]
MKDLNETILQKASGENRLNPDQQRLYLGTYRERVLLVATIEQANRLEEMHGLAALFDHYQQSIAPLTLKLSSHLSQSAQTFYMKLAQEKQIPFSLIEENTNQSSYGLVVHTDHAINQETIDVLELLPKKQATESRQSEMPKKSFWSKLFGKS